MEKGNACADVTFPLVNVPIDVGMGVRVDVKVQVIPLAVCVKAHIPRC